MTNLWIWILLSLALLIMGILSLTLLLNRYREKLLHNFSQKLGMTFWLAVIFGIFFLLGNAVLVYYVMKVKGNFAWYLQHPVVFAREGLIFFILNSFLILSCRSLIKGVTDLLNG